jgi:hypothetical protein
MTDIVTKLWGFCHTLRHDGIDYGDYIEQLTYLLFLSIKSRDSKFRNPNSAPLPPLTTNAQEALCFS